MQTHGLSLWARWIFNLLNYLQPTIFRLVHQSAGAQSATNVCPTSDRISARHVVAIEIAPLVDGPLSKSLYVNTETEDVEDV